MGWAGKLGPDTQSVNQRLPATPASGAASLDYRGQRPLERVGSGWTEFGIAQDTPVISGLDLEHLRAVMAGRCPLTAAILVQPKQAADPRSTLAAAPLVRALTEIAEGRTADPGGLFTDAWSRRRYQRLWVGIERVGDHRVPVTDLQRLAAAVGLCLDDVYAKSDLATARSHASSRVRVGNRGYVDLPSPKSVSLLYALGLLREDPGVARAVEEEFLAAGRAAAEAVEAWCIYGLVGHHGAGRHAARIAASGMTATMALHRAAHPVPGAVADDPNLRIELMVANLARCADGKWRTVAAGGRDVFDHIVAVSELFKACVRSRLSARLGVAWEPGLHTGAWEIAGIGQQVRDIFSQRSRQIAVAAPSRASVRERVCIGYVTARPSPPNAFREGHAWAQRAADHGIDPEAVVQSVVGRWSASDGDVHGRLADQLWDPRHGPAAGRAHVRRTQVLASAAALLRSGVNDRRELEHLVVPALDDERVVRLPSAGAAHLSNSDRFALQRSMAAPP